MQNSSYFDFSTAFTFKLDLEIIGIRELITAAENNACDVQFITDNIIPKFLDSIPLLFIIFQRKAIKEALSINSLIANKYPKSMAAMKTYIFEHITVSNKLKLIFNKIRKRLV